MKQSFTERLLEISRRKGTRLCVGIDPDPEKLPPGLESVGDRGEQVRHFSKAIIEATAPFAAAFKFNLAFFEALGKEGWSILADVLKLVPSDTLTIADAKRGDIGNSARFYARALLDDLPFDSITLSPYMGYDSILPFLEFEGKAAFILVRTSNPGGNDFQMLSAGGSFLYEHIARKAMSWGSNLPGSIGLVVGATDVSAMTSLRDICPDAPFLIPGVGAQGGNIDDVIRASGSGPILVNSSRDIIYASSESDFADAAADAAARLRKDLKPVTQPPFTQT